MARDESVIDDLDVEEPELGGTKPLLDEELEDPSASKETVDNDDPNDDADDDENEVTVVIGDDETDDEENQKMPQWVKDLRKSDREKTKQLKEMRAKLDAQAKPKPAVEKPGTRPTLKQFEYDEDKYEAALTGWFDKKKKYEAAQQAITDEETQRKTAWEGTVKEYKNKAKALKIKNFDEAEQTVTTTLSKTQFGMIVDGADNPAIVVAALDANPKQLEKVAKITNPVKFAFAVSKLETQMKVKARTPRTGPEKVVHGKRGSAGSVDRKLESLRAEAAKTGNMTKVAAYKRLLKQKGK